MSLQLGLQCFMAYKHFVWQYFLCCLGTVVAAIVILVYCFLYIFLLERTKSYSTASQPAIQAFNPPSGRWKWLPYFLLDAGICLLYVFIFCPAGGAEYYYFFVTLLYPFCWVMALGTTYNARIPGCRDAWMLGCWDDGKGISVSALWAALHMRMGLLSVLFGKIFESRVGDRVMFQLWSPFVSPEADALCRVFLKFHIHIPSSKPLTFPVNQLSLERKNKRKPSFLKNKWHMKTKGTSPWQDILLPWEINEIKGSVEALYLLLL